MRVTASLVPLPLQQQFTDGMVPIKKNKWRVRRGLMTGVGDWREEALSSWLHRECIHPLRPCEALVILVSHANAGNVPLHSGVDGTVFGPRLHTPRNDRFPARNLPLLSSCFFFPTPMMRGDIHADARNRGFVLAGKLLCNSQRPIKCSGRERSSSPVPESPW